jgi:predicted small lipoprotein YifL
MQTAKTTLLVLICASVLGACGLKGPLYLPEEKPAVEQASAVDSDTEKENEEKENSAPR